MGWKNWPYWSRGGLVGFLIVFSSGIFLIIGSIYEEYKYSNRFISCNFFGFYGYDLCLGLLKWVIMASFIFFIIGAIIGLIIEKLKSKKSNIIKQA